MKKFAKKFGQVCAVIGAQWGDEGKGKLVDILASQYDIIVRPTGGANAGHTIYFGKDKVIFHLIPSGMMHSKKNCLIGNGTVIHFPTFFEEIKTLKKMGISIANRLFISPRSHIVFDYHKVIDKLQEERKAGKKVGTTLRGIGPAYTDKISRIGIRTGELENFENFKAHYLANLKLLQKMHGFRFDPKHELRFFKSHQKQIVRLLRDASLTLDEALKAKKTILLEGANGTLLDIDHGTYPYVTSSNASIGGIIAGCGIKPSAIKSIIGIVKAYVTRVGGGPFPTELKDSLGDRIREQGGEYGSTTGRPRRIGWFDAFALKYSIMINGITHINLTKLDVLTGLPKIKIGVAYKCKGKKLNAFPCGAAALENAKVDYIELPGWNEDVSRIDKFEKLPKNAQKYVKTIENLLKVPVAFIGIGKQRGQMIVC